MKTKPLFYAFAGFLMLALGGVWAVAQKTTPADFDPGNPRQVPDTTVIDISINGIPQIGEIYMIEGLERETLGIGSGTVYPRLVLHGIFDRDMRDWHEDIMNGQQDRKKIDINLRNEQGTIALEIDVLNAYPVKYSIPPLNTDGSTRYIERMEFMYDSFDIVN